MTHGQQRLEFFAPDLVPNARFVRAEIRDSQGRLTAVQVPKQFHAGKLVRMPLRLPEGYYELTLRYGVHFAAEPIPFRISEGESQAVLLDWTQR